MADTAQNIHCTLTPDIVCFLRYHVSRLEQAKFPPVADDCRQCKHMPVFWTLPPAFLGKSAAAAAIGVINSLGNLGGFAGPYIFGYLRTSTGNYETGLWFLAGCMLMAGALAALIRVPRKR